MSIQAIATVSGASCKEQTLQTYQAMALKDTAAPCLLKGGVGAGFPPGETGLPSGNQSSRGG